MMPLLAAAVVGATVALFVEEAKDVPISWVDELVTELEAELTQRNWLVKRLSDGVPACGEVASCTSEQLRRSGADVLVRIRVFGGLHRNQVIIDLSTLRGDRRRVEQMHPGTADGASRSVRGLLDGLGLLIRIPPPTLSATASPPTVELSSSRSGVPEWLPWVIAAAGAAAEGAAVFFIASSRSAAEDMRQHRYIDSEFARLDEQRQTGERVGWIFLSSGAVVLGTAAILALTD